MIFEIIAAFAAVPAFAVIFDVSRSELIFCAAAGVTAESAYQAAHYIIEDNAFAFAFAAAAVTAEARIFANRRRVPVTIYLVSGIIPLVPGAGMYNTVFNIIASDYTAAVTVGMDTMKTASAVAVGIMFMFALPNKLFFKRK